jgi:hypothetical protein
VTRGKHAGPFSRLTRVRTDTPGCEISCAGSESSRQVKGHRSDEGTEASLLPHSGEPQVSLPAADARPDAGPASFEAPARYRSSSTASALSHHRVREGVLRRAHVLPRLDEIRLWIRVRRALKALACGEKVMLSHGFHVASLKKWTSTTSGFGPRDSACPQAARRVWQTAHSCRVQHRRSVR